MSTVQMQFEGARMQNPAYAQLQKPPIPTFNVQQEVPSNMEQVPSSVQAVPVKRRSGRPPGTRNKVKVIQPEPPTVLGTSDVHSLPKRPPCRPPGSGKKTVDNSLQPMTVAPSKTTVPTKRKRTTTLKRMELSITICITGSDLSPQLFPLVDDFLQRECEASLFAVERGGSLLNLHLHGVIAIICTSALDVKKRITAAIHWDENRPLGAGVCVKKLTNKGIHTFVGMVGYCLKDRKEFHFRVTMKNISDAVQREGMMLFTFFGAADLKNRVELNPSNIMQRALQYNKYVSHHPLGTSFRGCIRGMLVGGHYTPSTTWLINKGMDKSCMAALWKCYVQPGTITLADVDQIFFWMPRLQPSRYIEGVDHGLQFLKTSVLNDMVDSDHIPADTEQISGNPAAHDLPDWASFISLIPGVGDAQCDSSDRPLERIGSNCLCCG
ncbi:hypothetical protein R1sor_020130 [Riccia sorocarpa]|uniref:Replitron HUH endonuclease domain-containing protein n=1 Tax=Riccia sorocarpa TaxID=122646 RepID=A0ABD3IEJ7_9MARC